MYRRGHPDPELEFGNGEVIEDGFVDENVDQAPRTNDSVVEPKRSRVNGSSHPPQRLHTARKTVRRVVREADNLGGRVNGHAERGAVNGSGANGILNNVKMLRNGTYEATLGRDFYRLARENGDASDERTISKTIRLSRANNIRLSEQASSEVLRDMRSIARNPTHDGSSGHWNGPIEDRSRRRPAREDRPSSQTLRMYGIAREFLEVHDPRRPPPADPDSMDAVSRLILPDAMGWLEHERTMRIERFGRATGQPVHREDELTVEDRVSLDLMFTRDPVQRRSPLHGGRAVNGNAAYRVIRRSRLNPQDIRRRRERRIQQESNLARDALRDLGTGQIVERAQRRGRAPGGGSATGRAAQHHTATPTRAGRSSRDGISEATGTTASELRGGPVQPAKTRRLRHFEVRPSTHVQPVAEAQQHPASTNGAARAAPSTSNGSGLGTVEEVLASMRRAKQPQAMVTSSDVAAAAESDHQPRPQQQRGTAVAVTTPAPVPRGESSTVASVATGLRETRTPLDTLAGSSPRGDISRANASQIPQAARSGIKSATNVAERSPFPGARRSGDGPVDERRKLIQRSTEGSSVLATTGQTLPRTFS